MTTQTVKPIHPANAPIWEASRSYMHLEPATRAQIVKLERIIRAVGPWSTRDADIALILGAGWEPGTPLDRMSKGAASWLMSELQRGLGAVRGEAGDE
jgi:hypothetical protein